MECWERLGIWALNDFGLKLEMSKTQSKMHNCVPSLSHTHTETRTLRKAGEGNPPAEKQTHSLNGDTAPPARPPWPG